jgi:hypothetical protein
MKVKDNQIKIDRSSRLFFILFFVCIIASVFSVFYRMVILKDYEVFYYEEDIVAGFNIFKI